jgi:hypothetical protein
LIKFCNQRLLRGSCNAGSSEHGLAYGIQKQGVTTLLSATHLCNYDSSGLHAARKLDAALEAAKAAL